MIGVILLIVIVVAGILFWQTNTRDYQNKNNGAVNPEPHMPGTPMSLEDAQAMVQLWITESNATNIVGSVEADPQGSFLIRVGGAYFRYMPADKVLLVSGVVRYEMKSFGKFPDRWQRLVEAGRREYTTLMYGEAEFELYHEPLFGLEPDVVLLTKAYHERLSDGRLLGIQIRWLLLDANYWFVTRYNEVNGMTTEDEIKDAPAKNEWMLKNRPKPW